MPKFRVSHSLDALPMPVRIDGWVAVRRASREVPLEQTRCGCPVVWLAKAHVPKGYAARRVQVTVEFVP